LMVLQSQNMAHSYTTSNSQGALPRISCCDCQLTATYRNASAT
jgi:hypothetical protein